MLGLPVTKIFSDHNMLSIVKVDQLTATTYSVYFRLVPIERTFVCGVITGDELDAYAVFDKHKEEIERRVVLNISLNYFWVRGNGEIHGIGSAADEA